MKHNNGNPVLRALLALVFLAAIISCTSTALESHIEENPFGIIGTTGGKGLSPVELKEFKGGAITENDLSGWAELDLAAPNNISENIRRQGDK